MELYNFIRFHVREGNEAAALDALGQMLPPSRAEPGCLGMTHFQGNKDPRLFFIHARWRDEAAFATHAKLPHTIGFTATMASLADEPQQIIQTHLLG